MAAFDVVDLLMEERWGVALHQTNQLGKCALHIACERNSIRIVNLLLQKGAKPNQTDNLRESSIRQASRRGQHAIVRALLAAADQQESDFADQFR